MKDGILGFSQLEKSGICFFVANLAITQLMKSASIEISNSHLSGGSEGTKVTGILQQPPYFAARTSFWQSRIRSNDFFSNSADGLVPLVCHLFHFQYSEIT